MRAACCLEKEFLKCLISHLEVEHKQMRLGLCCVELHHGTVLETLSLPLLTVTK